jgi:hypothetical protein
MTANIAYQVIKPENQAPGILRSTAMAARVAGKLSVEQQKNAETTPAKTPSTMALIFIPLPCSPSFS